MRGLWLEDRRLSYRTDLPVPEPAPGEALVRVLLAGICRTDLELERGYYPYSGIPGHEFVGRVIRAATGPALEGKRIVGEINAVCHECEFCRRGLPNHCSKRTVLGIVGRQGALAEYLVLPVENLKEVPETVADRKAVFTEPLAAAVQILEQVQIRPTDRVLLVGAGKLGQLVARVLHEYGAHLLVKGRYPGQMQLLEAAGIPCTDLEPPDSEFEIVVEATGSPSGLETACRCVRPRGTIVLKSTYEGRAEIDFSRIVVDEISLVGSRCGPFEPALDLLESGRILPESLIGGCFPLEDGMAAFRQAGAGGSLKILIEI
ncbi:MAG: alcohol dehydrogenase catalytic domain-containing protein [Acidobacteriota bacterium]